jgi:hypothetical protein
MKSTRSYLGPHDHPCIKCMLVFRCTCRFCEKSARPLCPNCYQGVTQQAPPKDWYYSPTKRKEV